MKNTFLFLLIISLAVFINCQEKLDPGASKTAGLANDWFADLYLNGKPVYGKLQVIHTYNVASPTDDLIWIDDEMHLWNFKVAAAVNNEALTFSCAKAKSATKDNKGKDYIIDVTITEGKIMPLAAKSPAKVSTDSIYMKIEFSDEVGAIYEIRGFARTKFGLSNTDPQ